MSHNLISTQYIKRNPRTFENMKYNKLQLQMNTVTGTAPAIIGTTRINLIFRQKDNNKKIELKEEFYICSRLSGIDIILGKPIWASNKKHIGQTTDSVSLKDENNRKVTIPIRYMDMRKQNPQYSLSVSQRTKIEAYTTKIIQVSPNNMSEEAHQLCQGITAQVTAEEIPATQKIFALAVAESISNLQTSTEGPPTLPVQISNQTKNMITLTPEYILGHMHICNNEEEKEITLKNRNNIRTLTSLQQLTEEEMEKLKSQSSQHKH